MPITIIDAQKIKVFQPEPLKKSDILIKRKDGQHYKYVRLERMKSVTEWLKKNICLRHSLTKNQACRLINEAFNMK